MFDLEEMDVRKAVEFAITTEQLGAHSYERLARKFSDDEELVEIFTRLAKDEKLHERQFKELLEKVDDKPTKGYAEKWGVLRAMAISEFFGKRGVFGAAEDTIKDRDDAFGRAFEMEKATLGYYRALNEVMGGNPIIEEIIEYEKSHMLAIMKYLLTEAKMRGLSDPWIKS